MQLYAFFEYYFIGLLYLANTILHQTQYLFRMQAWHLKALEKMIQKFLKELFRNSNSQKKSYWKDNFQKKIYQEGKCGIPVVYSTKFIISFFFEVPPTAHFVALPYNLLFVFFCNSVIVHIYTSSRLQRQLPSNKHICMQSYKPSPTLKSR